MQGCAVCAAKRAGPFSSPPPRRTRKWRIFFTLPQKGGPFPRSTGPVPGSAAARTPRPSATKTAQHRFPFPASLALPAPSGAPDAPCAHKDGPSPALPGQGRRHAYSARPVRAAPHRTLWRKLPGACRFVLLLHACPSRERRLPAAPCSLLPEAFRPSARFTLQRTAGDWREGGLHAAFSGPAQRPASSAARSKKIPFCQNRFSHPEKACAGRPFSQKRRAASFSNVITPITHHDRLMTGRRTRKKTTLPFPGPARHAKMKKRHT